MKMIEKPPAWESIKFTETVMSDTLPSGAICLNDFNEFLIIDGEEMIYYLAKKKITLPRINIKVEHIGNKIGAIR